MTKSMTGYGSASGASGRLAITIELRSVNSRFLDCNVRLPRGYTVLEDALKERIQKSISRGKLDVFVTLDASQVDEVVVGVNENLAKAYLNALKALSASCGVANDVTAMSLARFPDVLSVTKAETDMDALREDMLTVLDAALQDFDAMRCREGEKLRRDVLEKAARIEELVSLAEARSPVTVKEYHNRLERRIREILEGRTVDEIRLLTEVALFADKTAVSEETVRLRSHLAQLRQLLEAEEPVGRKLDFLVQEFNREANTIGSKGNDVEMAKIVVELKSEIEKIREQIQNIE